MTSTTVTALFLIFVPIGFNAAFALLAARFDYPDILREPTADVLAKFRVGGTSLILTWWFFALTAILMVPLVVLLGSEFYNDTTNSTIVLLGMFVGVLAAVVQFLGLIRWTFLVPFLARESANVDASDARMDAIDVVFQAFNRYLGVAVGEHLGYLFTGAWTALVGVSLIQCTFVGAWLGIAGIIIGPILMLCAFEFVGKNEEGGWKVAEFLTPIVYVAWSLWLIAIGVALLV